MERYTVLFPQSIAKDDHAGRIETYLQAQGFETAGVTVRWDDEERVTVTVRATADPTQALQSYTPTITADEQARADVLADAQDAVAAIRTKSSASRTATEKVLLALAIDEPVLTPSTPEEPIPESAEVDV
jgi:hypothetical protein